MQTTSSICQRPLSLNTSECGYYNANCYYYYLMCVVRRLGYINSDFLYMYIHYYVYTVHSEID